jgi:hypothetical protein
MHAHCEGWPFINGNGIFREREKTDLFLDSIRILFQIFPQTVFFILCFLSIFAYTLRAGSIILSGLYSDCIWGLQYTDIFNIYQNGYS